MNYLSTVAGFQPSTVFIGILCVNFPCKLKIAQGSNFLGKFLGPVEVEF